MKSASNDQLSSKTHPRQRKILLVVVCFVCISLYLLRFIQVINMRESMLQRKKYKIIFTSLATSKVIGNKNSILVQDLQLVLPQGVQIRPGDHVEAVGTFKKGLLSKFDTNLSLSVQSIHIYPLRSSYGFLSVFRLLHVLEGVPQVIERRISGVLEPSQASLLIGIVFGGSSNLPPTLLQDTKNTGLIHITAASGYNVALLVGFSLVLFTRMFSRRISAQLCLITVIAYSCMAGLSPPIVRAALMSILYLLSLSLGRTYHARWSLAISGAIMLIYQPFLIFSPSFLLSFSATAGVLFQDLFFSSPHSLEKEQGILEEIKSVLGENLRTTISVLIFTTPVLIYFFGTFSLVSVLSNTALLWMVGPFMYAGLVLSGIVCISPLVSSLLAVPISLALEVFIRSVHLFSQFPFASVPLTKPHLLGVFAWYICLLGYSHHKLAMKKNE